MRSHPTAASLALALVSTLTACGHAMTQADRDQFEKELRGQFPDKRFMVGFGEGKSRVEAEERARAQVAAAVKSEVQETLRAFDREQVSKGRSDASKDVTRELVSRVDTTFGAFILPRGAREVGGTWQAAAAADRAGLDQAIEADAQRRVREADSLWRQLAASKEWLDAAPAWCGAAQAASELDALHVERLAVSGRPIWTEDRLKLWTAASRRRAAAKSSIVIHVTATDASSIENPAPALVQALQGAGWRAEKGDASRCAPEGLAVDARVERECRRSAIGVEVCKAAMVVEGRPCGAPQALFTERSPDAHATHSSDPEAAFRRAAGLIEVKPTVNRVVAKVLAVVGDSCSGAVTQKQ
jgi:hypothetical protein